MSEMIEAPMSATEIAVVEANAVARGIPLDQLMENAGRAVAEEVQKRVPPAPARVAIVAGPGNNGGDGSAAAFHLAQWGHAVEVWMLLPPTEIRSPWARRCFERVAGRVPVHTTPVTAPQLSEFAVVVDAMLGSGQSGPLRAPYREAVAAIRASGIPVLSIDVPTGLHDPEGLRPRWTIALTALKEGMSPASCGEITVREIGIPLEARIETGPGDFLYYPSPSRRGRRGRAGRLVIVGGGPYAGAPALAAMAALRSGAERATVFAPRPAADRVQGFSPNLVVRAVGEERFERRDVRAIRNALYAAPPKAVLIGMGAGRAPETVEALGELIEALVGTVPLVVDADGLDALPTEIERRGGYDLVATPNPGEFIRVFGGVPDGPPEQQLESVRGIAAHRGLTLLVKGAPDLISDGRLAAVNTHHALPMTVSGVGDVLAGAVGALMADGVPPFGACRLASYLVGDAGIRAAEHRGFGLVATDIIDEIPAALVEGLRRVHPTG